MDYWLVNPSVFVFSHDCTTTNRPIWYSLALALTSLALSTNLLPMAGLGLRLALAYGSRMIFGSFSFIGGWQWLLGYSLTFLSNGNEKSAWARLVYAWLLLMRGSLVFTDESPRYGWVATAGYYGSSNENER